MAVENRRHVILPVFWGFIIPALTDFQTDS